MQTLELDVRQIVQDAVSDMERDMAAMLDRLHSEMELFTPSFCPSQQTNLNEVLPFIGCEPANVQGYAAESKD